MLRIKCNIIKVKEYRNIKFILKKFISRVKDGVIVPGQVGLSGPPTLVRGPYPH